jgi:hypothetical protein
MQFDYGLLEREANGMNCVRRVIARPCTQCHWSAEVPLERSSAGVEVGSGELGPTQPQMKTPLID